MPDECEGMGWKISEVVELLGLSRRDVQRACYGGKGGTGLLAPRDSSWGRRAYSADDLAVLFVVAELRRDGLELSEVARAFEEAHGRDVDDRAQLAERVRILRDRKEEMADRVLEAQALLAATAGTDSQETKKTLGCLVKSRFLEDSAARFGEVSRGVDAALVTCVLALSEARVKGDAPNSPSCLGAVKKCLAELGAAVSMSDASAFVSDELENTAVGLAIDLWLGQGTTAFSNAAWGKALRGQA